MTIFMKADKGMEVENKEGWGKCHQGKIRESTIYFIKIHLHILYTIIHLYILYLNCMYAATI